MNNSKQPRMVQHTLDPKNPPPLSAEDKARLEALNRLPDSELDLSDIPELTDEQLARMVRANPHYRVTKTSTSIRLDSDVLAWLKQAGRGWQTRINEILRQEMLRGQES